MCVCVSMSTTTTLICIWNVCVLMLCVYDISVCRLVMWRSEPPCWPAAWPVYTLWSFGWKSGDESVNFLCSLSSSRWNSAFYKHVISTFPYHLIFHAFHLLYETFYPLSFPLCTEKDCINTSLPESPEFHYEPLTHVTSDLIQQIGSR